MTDSDALERTLAAARAAFVAPAAARARLRAGLQESGAFGTAKPSAPAALARAGVARSTVSVLVALGFAAGYWLGHAPARELAANSLPSAPAVSTPPPPVSAPAAAIPAGETAPPAAPSQTSGVARSSDATQAAAERAHSPPPRGKAAPRSTPSSKANSFAQELALLQRAERALRAGEAGLSLSLVGELERRYPASTLSEERSAVRIMAECAAALPDARGRAQRFLSDRLASVYSDRVRSVCALDAATQPPGESDGSRAAGH